eukprot:GSChrysophyteH2.ASY1.ANO1.624.1 assembled CDS
MPFGKYKDLYARFSGSEEESAAASADASAPAAQPAAAADGKPAPQLGKFSGKKICCSCPDTKAKRDECVVGSGESECADLIEAHKACLRREGFTVK